MSSPLVLFVDDDSDIVFTLRMILGSQDFQIDIAENGLDALKKARLLMPHLILLDVMLSDIDGYEVCRSLQGNPRTSHIPIIFLSQRDERSDILQGQEVGACDYITKPFDVMDLKQRMQNAIARFGPGLNPYSRLPGAGLVDKQLHRFAGEKGWVLLDIRIENFEQLTDIYGYEAGYNVSSHISRLVTEAVEDVSPASDFIGHVKDDHFIILTTADKASPIGQNLDQRFESERQRLYSLAGLIRHGNQNQAAPMSLVMGRISSEACQTLSPKDILLLAARSSDREM